MEKLLALQEIVNETYNTEHMITCTGKEWKIYIVKSRTLYSGTLDEIIDLATEEFTSYRKPSTQKEHVKFYKPFSYK